MWNFLRRVIGVTGTDMEIEEIRFPLLDPVRDLAPAQWLRDSMETLGASVGTLLPGHFAAYARIEHPPIDGQSTEGTLPPTLLPALLEHLRGATATPEQCYFAVWEGFGEPQLIIRYPAGQVPSKPAQPPRRRRFHEPRLELPDRAYHVFTGPIEAAMTSLSRSELGQQSANLWWPGDHAWCVATEIDLAWTCVGGPASAIDAILRDGRFEVSPMSP